MNIKTKEFETIFEDLKSIASQIGVKIRYERGDFKGGYCLIHSDRIIVINKLSTVQRKSVILAKALSELGLDDIYITPKLRQIILELKDSL